jgi:hypothetical protein
MGASRKGTCSWHLLLYRSTCSMDTLLRTRSGAEDHNQPHPSWLVDTIQVLLLLWENNAEDRGGVSRVSSVRVIIRDLSQ